MNIHNQDECLVGFRFWRSATRVFQSKCVLLLSLGVLYLRAFVVIMKVSTRQASVKFASWIIDAGGRHYGVCATRHSGAVVRASSNPSRIVISPIPMLCPWPKEAILF